MNLETRLEDVTPVVPDTARREGEFGLLLDLSRRQAVEEDSPLGAWHVLEGSGIVFSAPHEVTHIRDGAAKAAERGTGALAMALARHTGGSAIATTGSQAGDPNWDADHPFLMRAAALDASIAAIDIHMMRPRGVELCIGLGTVPGQAGHLWPVIAEEAVAAGIRFAVNWPFGANEKTMTSRLQRRGVRALQLELSGECFDESRPACVRTWSAIARAAARIAGSVPPG